MKCKGTREARGSGLLTDTFGVGRQNCCDVPRGGLPYPARELNVTLRGTL
ncbi:hypothetical protein SAMN06265347_1305 [Halobellus salinus]|nr:hypothetical protein SAMN06265347_1305 [Halobellus salinus]